MVLSISRITQRRFILGKQGLYPGRRWAGKTGVAQALRADCVVQVDPLNVVARSHDIALYGRVTGYQPAHLDALLYTDRVLFDYGGTVKIHPMEELPYWRVVMARKQKEARHVAYAEAYRGVIDSVLSEIRRRGALGARDFARDSIKAGSFRSDKVSVQALYYLWLAGELMTHGRRGFERLYDLRERVAPPALHHAAAPAEADSYFARKAFQKIGMTTARGWRTWFAGTIERKVEAAEATVRLDALLTSSAIAPITIEDDPRTPRYVLVEDLPLLEMLHSGKVPTEWQPLSTSTDDEVIFLAPLEIVSARGRALPLFGFEYLWEVYKPREKRRWGYYTLPVLYRDHLVARLDPVLHRASGTLELKGFWLECSTQVDDAFARALANGLRSFMTFAGAQQVDLSAIQPLALRQSLQERLL